MQWSPEGRSLSATATVAPTPVIVPETVRGVLYPGPDCNVAVIAPSASPASSSTVATVSSAEELSRPDPAVGIVTVLVPVAPGAA